MKRCVAAVALTLFFAASAMAADSVVFPAPKKGPVTFNHKAHQAKTECKTCHGEGAPAKIALDMSSAHKLCKGCHADKGKGPTKCNDCHQKKEQ